MERAVFLNCLKGHVFEVPWFFAKLLDDRFLRKSKVHDFVSQPFCIARHYSPPHCCDFLVEFDHNNPIYKVFK